jgi:hypothetical protein
MGTSYVVRCDCGKDAGVCGSGTTANGERYHYVEWSDGYTIVRRNGEHLPLDAACRWLASFRAKESTIVAKRESASANAETPRALSMTKVMGGVSHWAWRMMCGLVEYAAHLRKSHQSGNVTIRLTAHLARVAKIDDVSHYMYVEWKADGSAGMTLNGEKLPPDVSQRWLDSAGDGTCLPGMHPTDDQRTIDAKREKAFAEMREENRVLLAENAELRRELRKAPHNDR